MNTINVCYILEAQTCTTSLKILLELTANTELYIQTRKVARLKEVENDAAAAPCLQIYHRPRVP